MRFGLSEQQYAYLQENLFVPLSRIPTDVWIFGSRATGKQREFSDVDILISRKNPVIVKLVRDISETFENGNFPFKVDIVFDEDLADSYRSSVDRDKCQISA